MSEPLLKTVPRPAVSGGTAGDGASRVSPRLTSILAGRAQPDLPDGTPKCLTASQLHALRAVLAQVVPHDLAGLDLVLRIDANLHARLGNGWRAETLPEDTEAYRQALHALDATSRRDFGSPFADLLDAAQRAMLTAIVEGNFVPATGGALDAGQMADWFEDLRSDAVRLYVSHPDAMSSIGYEGHANGAGDGAVFEGWSEAEIEGAR
jgi:hypothetical protein